MNYSYGQGNKVYGKDITEARYNALLETFYNAFDNLRKRIRIGKNYFEKDPNTSQLLEKRILGEGVYIPDEDEELIAKLANAYKTTKVDLEICANEKSQGGCQNLKFKGVNRCVFEKKWLSYIRGGDCVISEEIVKHVLNNLQSVVNIKWNNLEAFPVRNSDKNLPNPDEFTKTDMINILHDLTYHMKNVFKEKDLITVLEERYGGANLSEVSSEDLLYYVYLFSFIVYTAKYLTIADFNALLRGNNLNELQKMMNERPSKDNLVTFIVTLLSMLPRMERRSAVGWAASLVAGFIILFMALGFYGIFTSMAPFLTAKAGTKASELTSNPVLQNLQEYIPKYDLRHVYETRTAVPADPLIDAVREGKVNQDVDIPNFTDYIVGALREKNFAVVDELMKSKNVKNISSEQWGYLVRVLIWDILTNISESEFYIASLFFDRAPKTAQYLEARRIFEEKFDEFDRFNYKQIPLSFDDMPPSVQIMTAGGGAYDEGLGIIEQRKQAKLNSKQPKVQSPKHVKQSEVKPASIKKTAQAVPSSKTPYVPSYIPQLNETTRIDRYAL
jgi:hypothetical protein